MTTTRSPADLQAAKIVEEFERFASEMTASIEHSQLHRQWLVGAKLFAADLLRAILPDGGYITYCNQIDSIRDRVLPPVEVQK